MSRTVIWSIAIVFIASISQTASGQVTLRAISTPFNSPVGIDYHEPTDSVVLSVNYSSGQPHNFERVLPDGTSAQFSEVSGLTEEVKIATVRSGNSGGFVTGDLFTGTGVDGQIARITDGGATLINPFVDLPGDNNGLMRGSLYVDRTDIYGGDLVAVTTAGEVWRADSAGNPTMIADVDTHLEGVITVPNDADRYGPLAGKIIAGAEGVGLLYSFDDSGFVDTYNVSVNIEDIDLVAPNENFFGVNFGTSRILGAAAADFAPYVGDILLTQESHSGVGLFRLLWDGNSLSAEELTLDANSAVPGLWEHVTFAPAGIVEINSIPNVEDAVIEAQVGDLISYTFTGSDSNMLPNPLTWTLDGFDGDTLVPTFDPDTQLFSWDSSGAMPGSYMAVVSAFDGQDSGSGTLTVHLVVPEPQSCYGLGIGVLAILSYRRKQSLQVQP